MRECKGERKGDDHYIPFNDDNFPTCTTSRRDHDACTEKEMT